MNVGLRVTTLAAALFAQSVGCNELPHDFAGNDASVPRAEFVAQAPPPPPAAATTIATAPDVKPETVEVVAPVEEIDPAEVEAAEEAKKHEAERAAFEAAYPLYGVVNHFLAQVFSAPSNKVRVLGYMRRGSQFRAKTRVNGPGCSQGWHEVPGHGFVCQGVGYQIGQDVQTFEGSPVPPALDDALPYAYARTLRDDVAQYLTIPTPEQRVEAARLFQQLHAADDRAHPAHADGAHDESVSAPPPPGQAADVGRLSATPALPEFLRMRMLKGFYVSLDRIENDSANNEFYRTIRGGYVDSSTLTEPQLPTMRGVVLGGAWQLPVAFVYRTGAHRFHVNPVNGNLIDDGAIGRQTPMIVANETFVNKTKTYVMSDEGVLVRDPAVRLIHTVPRPESVTEHDRWVHIDLSQQSLVAYEGDTPVFVTLVSSGKEHFETPQGLFQIQSKHVSTTMDMSSDENPEGAYSIEDVPWTMYFSGNYALHGAFWHNNFGAVRSHGCVNLSPIDARWLFQWSTPTLPASWHGVFGDRQHPGTWVYITE